MNIVVFLGLCRFHVLRFVQDPMKTPTSTIWRRSFTDKPTPPSGPLSPTDVRKVTMLAELPARRVMGASSKVPKLEKRIQKLEETVAKQKIELRFTTQGYWSMFVGFTTVLVTLPMWISNTQKDATAAKDGNSKLEERVSKMEKDNVTKKVEIEVKFPRDD